MKEIILKKVAKLRQGKVVSRSIEKPNISDLHINNTIFYNPGKSKVQPSRAQQHAARMAMMQPDQSVDRMLDILDRMNKRSQIDNDLLPQLQPIKPTVTSLPQPPLLASHPLAADANLSSNNDDTVDASQTAAFMVVSEAPLSDEVLATEIALTPTDLLPPEAPSSGNLLSLEGSLANQYVTSLEPSSELSDQLKSTSEVSASIHCELVSKTSSITHQLSSDASISDHLLASETCLVTTDELLGSQTSLADQILASVSDTQSCNVIEPGTLSALPTTIKLLTLPSLSSTNLQSYDPVHTHDNSSASPSHILVLGKPSSAQKLAFETQLVSTCSPSSSSHDQPLSAHQFLTSDSAISELVSDSSPSNADAILPEIKPQQ